MSEALAQCGGVDEPSKARWHMRFYRSIAGGPELVGASVFSGRGASMAPHFWYRVALDWLGCAGECSVRAFSRFLGSDSDGPIALTCADGRANLIVAPP